MIKINLLKSFYEASPESLQVDVDHKNIQVTFLKHIGVCCLGIAVLYVYEDFFNIPNLKAQSAAISAEIAEAVTFNQKMGGLKKEIERYEKDLKRLNTQTEFLQKVQKERTLSVDLINKMRDLVNPKVWLTNLDVTNASVEIRGEAESISDINDFNNRLSSTNYLKDVITISIENKIDPRIRDTSVQKFSIKASYVDGKQLLDESMPDRAEVKR